MAGEEAAYDEQLKLLMIGDSGVGKTCLLLRFVESKFMDSFITTIGIDFKTKVIPIGGKRVELQIWDTAGQERFRTITASYFRGAQGVALVYDKTARDSFENIESWTEQLHEHGDPSCASVVIANKSDLEGEVSDEEGEALARRFGVPFFACSAKTGTGVDTAMKRLGELALDALEKGAGALTGAGAGSEKIGLDTADKGGKAGGGCAC